MFKINLKLKVKYDLIDETGPQHSKTFQVKCTIYNAKNDSVIETYLSTGSSISKAKQSAAEIALTQTKLETPSTDQMRRKRTGKFKQKDTFSVKSHFIFC